MPYLTSERKNEIYFNFTDYDIKVLSPSEMKTAGDINYAIQLLAMAYLKTNGKKYDTLNSVVGAIECAKQEFIRRVVNPYEDKKILENGDVEEFHS